MFLCRIFILHNLSWFNSQQTTPAVCCFFLLFFVHWWWHLEIIHFDNTFFECRPSINEFMHFCIASKSIEFFFYFGKAHFSTWLERLNLIKCHKTILFNILFSIYIKFAVNCQSIRNKRQFFCCWIVMKIYKILQIICDGRCQLIDWYVCVWAEWNNSCKI